MRTREYRVLKYIKKHPKVTKEKLYKKFDFLKDDYKYVSEYVYISDLQPDVVDGVVTYSWVAVDTSTYELNHLGEEQLERKQHDACLFWFPYIITTIIALASVVIQILNFINGN